MINRINRSEFANSPESEFLDLELFNELEKKGIRRPEMGFRIEQEQNIDGELIDANISWVRFAKPENIELAEESELAAVEGKLYLPRNSESEEIILFTPGFPGGNAGRFEQRYAKHFTDNGYAFFTVRHNGTSLTNGEVSKEILNSSRRTEIAEKLNQHHIGGTREAGYSPEDIVKEPITPLISLEKGFKKIHLMGQSMGVAAIYNSLRLLSKNKEVMKKIGNVVGIAGYIGSDSKGKDDLWDGMNMSIDDMAEYEMGYVKKVDANMNLGLEGFKKSLHQVALANRKMEVPEHVGNVLVFTPEDPLIAGPDKSQDEYAFKYGPPSKRKLIIRDESNLGAEKPHSMLWISPANLVRAVQAKVSKHGPHYVKVPNSSEGTIEKG